jgi:hypothetical protein
MEQKARAALTDIFAKYVRKRFAKTLNGDWVALECKGRISKPNAQARNKAKEQAERLVSVNGVAPVVNIGGICYFYSYVMEFYWHDPTSEPEKVKNPIELTVSPAAWAYYYGPILELMRFQPAFAQQIEGHQTLLSIEQLDLQVGIHPEVLRLLNLGQWNAAKEIATKVAGERGEVAYRSDGISIVPGPSWSLPFNDEGTR